MNILRSLVEEGEKFTYKNFCSSFSQYGFPATYSQEWVVWRTRVESFIKSRFGENSVPYEALSKGLGIRVLGNEQKSFENAKALMLGALRGAEISFGDDSLQEVGRPHVSDTGVNRTNKVFVVHGHDHKAKNELEVFLREVGLEPVVLHRQPDEGQTIIEKFEKHSDVGFAFVILTPDEIAYTADQDSLEDSVRKKEYRARPNVIFEYGYFAGKLGRNRVCCLYTGDVTLPSDLNGLIYKKFSTGIDEAGYSIMKELKAAGYNINV